MPTWNELFDNEEYIWHNPHEKVIEMVRLLKDRKRPRILDLGCGAGRHLVYLAKEGFRVDGMDFSERGLLYASEWLLREGVGATLTRADMTELPYANNCFDALISIHVIFHNLVTQLRQSLREIYRVLRPGGMALLTFQSTRSYRFGRGTQLEPRTFIPDIGGDAGVPHHYMDLAEIGKELDQFCVWNVNLSEDLNEGSAKSSHWEIIAEKE
jgi:ubiquinone/menaquinone biosynthesis C-methylase UbiE